MNKQPTLILVDGSGYIFRGYFAIRSMTASDGTPVNAVFGYSSMILSLLADFEPEQIVVAFDTKGSWVPERDLPRLQSQPAAGAEDLVPQFALIREATEVFGLHQVEAAGWEADDLIATAAARAVEAGQEVVIVSADKDLMQARFGRGAYARPDEATLDR